MEGESTTTWEQAASISWALIWRFLALSVAFGIVISFGLGLPLVFAGFPQLGHQVENFAGVLGMAPGILVAVRLAIKKRYRGFQIVLEPSAADANPFGKLLLPAVSAVVMLGIVGGIYVGWKNQVKPQTIYHGIVLGSDGKRDVQYKLGEPTVVYSETKTTSGPFEGFHEALTLVKTDGFDQIPSGRNFVTYNQWGYEDNNNSNGGFPIQISFANGTVSSVSCNGKKSGDCPALLGINIGDDETHVQSLLGAPASALIDDLGWKTMIYPKLNVQFELQRQHIISIGIRHY